ncbi:hypothetical protein FAD87_RS09395 [Enterococcus hirae]
MTKEDWRWIEKLIECCREMKNTLCRFGDNPLIFKRDKDYQRSMIMLFIEIGEIWRYCLSDCAKNVFCGIGWKRFVWLRNRCVHFEYFELNIYEIWFYAHIDIPNLLEILEKEKGNMLLAKS